MLENDICKCGFGVRKTYEGQKDFDKYYIIKEITQVVTKVGEGEHDYIIENKEIITKKDIAKAILAQLPDAGIDAYLEPYLKNDEPVPVGTISEEIQDFSNMPENLAEAAEFGRRAREIFDNLDPELKQGLTLEQFLTNMSKEKLDAYVKSKMPENKEKKEKQEEGDDE